MIIYIYYIAAIFCSLIFIREIYIFSKLYSFNDKIIFKSLSFYTWIFFFYIILFSGYLFFNKDNDNNKLIIYNFLIEREPSFSEYLQVHFNYNPSSYIFRVDNYDSYFIEKEIESNNYLTKYFKQYDVDNIDDFVYKITPLYTTIYHSDFNDFEEYPQLKNMLNRYIQNDDFISTYEYQKMNQIYLDLKTNKDCILNFYNLSKHKKGKFIDWINMYENDISTFGYVTNRTADSIYKGLSYKEFLDYIEGFYWNYASLIQDVNKYNHKPINDMYNYINSDGFISQNEMDKIEELIEDHEYWVLLESEGSYYQTVAANYIIENNGAAKDELIKIKNEYGYFPYKTQDLINDSLESLIEGFEGSYFNSYFVYEKHFEHNQGRYEHVEYLIEEYNCIQLESLRKELFKDNLFSDFDYDKVFDVYYNECRK